MRARTENGYTLVELVVVVAILALIAAVAVPNMRLGSEQKLRLAAEDVADAIRFARSEAIRTGKAYGVTVNQVTESVRVEEYDLTTAPISSIDIVIHPIDKQPYDFNVNTRSATRGVMISNSQDVFDFTGFGKNSGLIFDGYGTPKWIDGSGPSTHLLSDGNIELSYDGQLLSVSVAPITGRVMVK